MRILGAGWVSEKAYGMVRKAKEQECAEGLYASLKQEGIFTERIKNFGRFEASTRRTFCAAALALHDADFSNPWKKVAVIGTGQEECAGANQTYFSDYVDNGRRMSRANLFIYTLATSPLAEIAIHFKLDGPLFYTSHHFLRTANGLLMDGDASHILAIWQEEDYTAAVVLGSEKTDDLQRFSALETPQQLIVSLLGHFSSQSRRGSGGFLW